MFHKANLKINESKMQYFILICGFFFKLTIKSANKYINLRCNKFTLVLLLFINKNCLNQHFFQ